MELNNKTESLKENGKTFYWASRLIDKKKFNDISQNIPLMQEIVTKMEKESKNFDINSTPTFIVNDKYKISGALSFKDFEKELLKSINAKKS